MTDIISLSPKEHDQAFIAVARFIGDGSWPSTKITQLVDKVFEAVNNHRLGEPVGTLRESPIRHQIYRRIELSDGHRGWAVYELSPKVIDDLQFNTDLLASS